MSEFLDELARTVARPMPRSRAIRLLGVAIASAAVGSVAPRPAAARGARHSRTFCHTAKCPLGHPPDPNDPFTKLCKCHEKPIVGVGGETTMCNRICCDPELHRCVCPPGAAGCQCKQPCGPDLHQCCSDDEFCSNPAKEEGNPRLGLCCKLGWSGCGPNGPGGQHEFCCAPHERCCEGGVCCEKLTKTCGPGYCRCKPHHTKRCGRDCCNPKREKCCPSRFGAPKHCAPKKSVCCGSSSCGPTQKCCRGAWPGGGVNEMCVPKRFECCGGVGFDPAKDKCCSPGVRCLSAGSCCGGLCCYLPEVCTQDGCQVPGP